MALILSYLEYMNISLKVNNLTQTLYFLELKNTFHINSVSLEKQTQTVRFCDSVYITCTYLWMLLFNNAKFAMTWNPSFSGNLNNTLNDKYNASDARFLGI